MPCGNYDNRPQLCREFTCGCVPCEKCDACEGNVVIVHSGVCPEQDAIWFKLHGFTIEQAVGAYSIHIPAQCQWYVPEVGSTLKIGQNVIYGGNGAKEKR